MKSSAQIEQDRLSRPRRGERERSGFFGARAVTGRQRHAVEGQSTLGNVQPRAPARLQVVRHRLSGLEPDAIDVRVLMNGRRAVAPVRRDDQHLGGVGVFGLRMPLGVAGRQAALARLNPDLQEVQRLGCGTG